MVVNGTDEAATQAAIDAFYERRLPTNVGLVVSGVIGVSGNVLVLMVLWRKKTMDMTHVLLHLITALDLATAAVMIPMCVIYNIAWFDIMNEPFCKIITAMSVFITYPGLFLVFGLSIYRYYSLSKFKKPNMKLYIVCVYILTLLLTFLTTVTTGQQEWADKDLPGYYCSTDDDYRTSFVHIFLVYSSSGTVILCLLCLFGLNAINMRKIRNNSVSEETRMTRRSTRRVSGFVSRGGAWHDKNSPPVKLFHEENNRDLINQESEITHTPDRRATIQIPIDTEVNNNTPYFTPERSSEIEKESGDLFVNNMPPTGESNSLQNVIEIPTVNEDEVNAGDKPETLRVRGNTSDRNSPFLIRYRITLKVFVMSFAYTVSYVAFFVVYTYINLGEHKSQSSQHDLFKYVLLPSMNIVYFRCGFNPVIYYLFDPVFRIQCMELLDKKKK